MRDSAAQLWVSPSARAAMGGLCDGGAVVAMAWRVDGVTRARQWRGTSCEHAIAAARGGTRARAARAWSVGGAGARARAASSKDAAACLAVALAPAAVVFRNRRRSPCLCQLDAFWQRARARGRGFHCATAVR